MNTGQSRWWQSRTVSAAPVTGWTSLAGGGNTASAESMWLSHFRSWGVVVPRKLNVSTAATVLSMMMSGGSAGGFLLKSTIISTTLRVFSSRLLRLHQTASCSTSCCKQTRLRPWLNTSTRNTSNNVTLESWAAHSSNFLQGQTRQLLWGF